MEFPKEYAGTWVPFEKHWLLLEALRKIDAIAIKKQRGAIGEAQKVARAALNGNRK